MSRIFDQKGKDAKTSVTFYKAIVQAVILFVSEMWMMTPWIGR